LAPYIGPGKEKTGQEGKRLSTVWWSVIKAVGYGYGNGTGRGNKWGDLGRGRGGNAGARRAAVAPGVAAPTSGGLEALEEDDARWNGQSWANLLRRSK
jgi:hypothetical protein